MKQYTVVIEKATETVEVVVEATDEKEAFDLFKQKLTEGDTFDAKTIMPAGFGDDYGNMVYFPQTVLAGFVETHENKQRAHLTRLGQTNVKYRRKNDRIYFTI
jgi:hypothetical protein